MHFTVFIIIIPATKTRTEELCNRICLEFFVCNLAGLLLQVILSDEQVSMRNVINFIKELLIFTIYSNVRYLPFVVAQ